MAHVLLNFLFFHSRRNYKFCRKCGLLGRRDNLQQWHFPGCQPQLKENESGFLKLNKRPDRHPEDVKQILKLLACDTVAFESDTETEDDQDITPGEKDNDPKKLNIQEPNPLDETKIQKNVPATQ